MERNRLYPILASMLIAALTFGQVGSGFLHNKHDAHEAVIDLDNDQPVVVTHGEHCKTCSIDLFSPFITTDFSIDLPGNSYRVYRSAELISFYSADVILSSGRAPPAC